MKMPDLEKNPDSNMENEEGSQCASCHKSIADKYLLKAIDQTWHEGCLKCSRCQCKLMEAGSTLFVKANMLLCKKDYLEMYCPSGQCALCHKPIPAMDMVMRLRQNVYHIDCFSCCQCEKRFNVGDKVYVCDNQLLCEYDYGERQVFAHMQQMDPNAAKQIIQKQVDMETDIMFKNAPVKNQTTKQALQVQDGAMMNCMIKTNHIL